MIHSRHVGSCSLTVGEQHQGQSQDLGSEETTSTVAWTTKIDGILEGSLCANGFLQLTSNILQTS
jgi:hypothetical protein